MFVSVLTIAMLAAVIGLLSSVSKRVSDMQGELRGMAMRMQDLRRRLEALQTEAPPQEPLATPPTLPDEPAPPVVATPAPIPIAAPTAPPPLPAAPVQPPPLPPVWASPPSLETASPLPALAEEPPEEPTRSGLAESAAEILRKIWSWILVGEEHRPQGVTLEYALATTWLMRLGTLVIVLCGAFFLVWSSERNLVGPVGRVAIVLVAGLSVLVGGVRLLGRQYHVLGQGLLGAGLLLLYTGVYAMGPRYGLVPTLGAFALMALVTLAAGVLALRLDSLLVAVLGIAGGYLTPLVIASPEPNLPVFYSYMLALGVAILAIALYKQWRLLNYLSFAFTYCLFIGSLAGPYRTEQDFPLALSFLVAFFITQSSLVYLHNILRRQRSTTLEIAQFTLNALLMAGLGYALIRDAIGRPYPALLAVWLALYYTIHVVVLLRRRCEDRPLMITCLALAGAAATWSLPLVMEKETLTIALSLLALLFLSLGFKLGSRFLQHLAYLLYAVVFYRLAVWDFGRNYGGPLDPTLTLKAYGAQFLDRFWTFGVAIASAVRAFVLQRRQPPPATGLHVQPATDTPALIAPGTARVIFYWTVVVSLFAFLHAECAAVLGLAPTWRLPGLTVLWCGLAAYFLLSHRTESRRGPMFWAMTVVLGITVFKLLAIDTPTWIDGPHLVCGHAYRPVDTAARLLDVSALVVALMFAWRLTLGRPFARPMAPLFGYAALALVFLFASLELNSLLHWKLARFQAGGLSMLWALFALAFIVGGIWRNVRALRFLGLALVAVVIGKVFLVDLRHMVIIVRVVAFFAVGILLLLGSFAYMHSNRKFTRHEDPEA